MIQTHYLRASVIIAASLLVATGSQSDVRGQDQGVVGDGAEVHRPVLPLSTAISESMRKKILITLKTTVLWQEKEYGIDDGVEVLMSVITNPSTDEETRATAINRLAHFSTSLQNRACLKRLCAFYDRVESRMERREILKCLTIAKDSAGLRLLHRVATTESDDVLRLQSATGLASWNIRDGVHQLIELLSSSAETGLRQVGAAAMISFTNLNERKDWNCPQEQIREAALAMAGDNREAYAKAAMKGYRDWFEANKERFPEWKPGDPLPKVDENERKPEADE